MATRRAVRTVALGSLLSFLPTVLGSAVAPPPIQARQPAPTSLTITARLCPLDYGGDAYAADCTEPLAGVTFHADGTDGDPATALTDGRGVVAFPGVAAPPYPRRVLLDEEVPGDFVHVAVVCGDLGGTALRVRNTGQGAELTVGAGARIVCDWYVIPEDRRAGTASLTIHNRLCPEGFAGPDYYGACHDTPAPAGLVFVAAPLGSDAGAEAATDATGNATLDLPPGEYTVRGGVPGEFARLAVFCAPAASPGTPFPFTTLRGGVRGPDDPTGIQIALTTGDDVVCDWYNTPESQRGSRPTTLTAAPIAPAAHPDSATAPVEFPSMDPVPVAAATRFTIEHGLT